MEVLRIQLQSESSLTASAVFYSSSLSDVHSRLETGTALLVIIMPAAPQEHDGWRRAVVRDLARAHAPQRVMLVAGSDESEITATLDYLENAPGVTGQYLKLAE